MTDLIVYCLAVYMAYYVANRSDLLKTPRRLVARHAPGWVTYAGSCALCFTWWVSVGLWLVGILSVDFVTLLAIPVINLVIDLAVRALIRANEPPPIRVESAIPSVSTSSGTITVTTASNMRVGEMVSVVNPLDHEQTR